MLINGFFLNNLEKCRHYINAKRSDIDTRLIDNFQFVLNPNSRNLFIIRLNLSCLNSEHTFVDEIFKIIESNTYDNKKDYIIFVFDQEAATGFNKRLYSLVRAVRPYYNNENMFYASEQLNSLPCDFNQFRHLSFLTQSNHIDNIVIKHDIKKEKIFLSFNLRVKEHRILLVGKVLKENLLDKFFLSFRPNWENININQVIRNSPYLTDDEKNEYKKLLSKDIILDENPRHEKLSYTTMLYKKSFISIVTETRFNCAELGFTEKTFKPIAYKHPFIIIGVPNLLVNLRALGYKTFHPWINEDYDNILDHKERFDAIIKEITRISKLNMSQLEDLWNNVLPIIEHNYKIHNNNFEHIDNNITSLFNFIRNLNYKLEDLTDPEKRVKQSRHSGGILKLRNKQ
jgi:hypothetical protein